ncbi:hypothetical protein PFISCL1PPCAC_2478, partial [Pristionchus fissidentatus]
ISVISSRVGAGGGLVSVAYFTGRGSNDFKSTHPTIDGSRIFQSLFHKDLYPRIFQSAEENVTIADILKGTERNSYLKSKGENATIPLIVFMRTSPVTINYGGLNYFWGKQFLPDKNTKKCEDYVSSNYRTTEHICDIGNMERCVRNISDVTQLFPFSFWTRDNERLFEFAWLCPKNKECCGWECCEPADSLLYTIFIKILDILMPILDIIFVIIDILIAFCFSSCFLLAIGNCIFEYLKKHCNLSEEEEEEEVELNCEERADTTANDGNVPTSVAIPMPSSNTRANIRYERYPPIPLGWRSEEV